MQSVVTLSLCTSNMQAQEADIQQLNVRLSEKDTAVVSLQQQLSDTTAAAVEASTMTIEVCTHTRVKCWLLLTPNLRIPVHLKELAVSKRMR